MINGFVCRLMALKTVIWYLPHIAGLGLLQSNHTPVPLAHQLRSQPAKGRVYVILSDYVILLDLKSYRYRRHSFLTFYPQTLKEKSFCRDFILNETPTMPLAFFTEIDSASDLN